MRQEPPSLFQIITKVLALETLEPFSAKINTRFDQFDMRSFLQGIGNDSFVLVYCYRAGRVDYVTSRLDRVNGAENKLFL